jgi:hypothetical protein
MTDNSLARASKGGHSEGASTTRTGISKSMSSREDVKVCAELGLGAIEAYRAIGAPFGDEIAGLEQWLNQTIADVAQEQEAIERIEEMAPDKMEGTSTL